MVGITGFEVEKDVENELKLDFKECVDKWHGLSRKCRGKWESSANRAGKKGFEWFIGHCLNGG